MRNSKESLQFDATAFYNSLMESLSQIVKKHLNELSHKTVFNAAKTVKKKLDSILGPYDYKLQKYTIDKEKLKDYLKTIKQPSVRKRIIKLYKEGKLEDILLQQSHIFATIANIGVEWLRDNTDVPISPEFFKAEGDSWGKYYKNTDRKPTEDEHNFYRYYTSMGTDIDGMTETDINRYHSALSNMLKAVHGIDL